METIMKATLKPRCFTAGVAEPPAKEVIQKYVQDRISHVKDLDTIDIDKLAEEACYHFDHNWNPLFEVPDIFYAVVEELLL